MITIVPQTLRTSTTLTSGPGARPILSGRVASAVARPSFRLPAYVAAILTGAALLTSQSTWAANTADNVINGSSDLTVAGSYSAGLPGTTSDVVFTNVVYNPAAFTLNSSLAIGTLDDLSSTALTIQNTSGTADTLTLSTAANSTAGSAAADLLYVATGGNLSLGGGTGNAALNLSLAVTGNLDIAGTGVATISSPITGAAAATFTKTGTGTLTFAGNGASTLGASTAGGTILNLSNGTTTFGIAGTDAPSLTIAGNNTGIYLTGGTFNMVNGTITETENQGFVIAGSQTYNQTGGTLSTSGIIEFANNGGASVVNVSNGTLTDTNGRIELAVRGTSTTTLSGTGAINTPSLVMTTTQLSGGAAGSTFNLNGGTLTTGNIVPGTNGTTGPGTTFNFNGGTLTASASSTTFMQGLTAANVLAGGAIINTGANNDTIGQSLLTGTAVGTPDGGLTKTGTGTLTLTGANTYTGATTINGGIVSVSSLANGGATSGIGASSNAAANLVLNGGTLQYTGATVSTDRAFTVGTGTTGATIDASGTGALTLTGSPVLATNASTSTLTFTGTNTGANTFSGTLSSTPATGGLIVAKTGAGTWTFGGANTTSTLTKGQLNVSAGTFNFGSSSADTTSLSLNGLTATGGNVGIFIRGGTFNMNGGTLTTANTQQGLVVQGSGTVYNQTGGLLNTTGGDIVEFANSGTTTQNISGGELRNASRIELNVNGATSVTNLSGTGLITTPSLVMLSNQTNNATSASTFNLNAGGTLATGAISRTTQTSTGTGSTIFNFNGGTLKATASSATFINGLTTTNAPNGGAVVKAGGAIINTNAFNDTVVQPLIHDSTLGATADGGLTKNGTGILTLASANTFTGPTTLSQGALTLNTATALSDTSALSLVAGTTLNLSAAAGTSETVFRLMLDGNNEPAGTYTASQLMAFDPSITFTSSLGETLTVTAVPEPSTWAAGLTCLGLLALRLRRRLFARA